MNLATNYEFFLILTLKQGEEFIDNVTEKFKKSIEEFSNLSKIEKWGKRKLAYPIKKENEGFYVLFEFSSTNKDLPASLQRNAQITDGVLRSLIIRK